jgi:DNA-binding transcriptional LysR family regulator
MDQLHAITAFIKIVDAGSITAAADALEVSQPSMVRTLAALERELGVRLLNRTTRRMSLTDEGRDFYERGKHIVAALEDARSSLSARRAAPRGRLRIASSVAFGRNYVAPVVAAFLAEQPDIYIDLLLLDRVVDLVEEGIDVAVRIARLPDSSLVARPLGEARRVIVASPALARKSAAPICAGGAALRSAACHPPHNGLSPRAAGRCRLRSRACWLPIKSMWPSRLVKAAWVTGALTITWCSRNSIRARLRACCKDSKACRFRSTLFTPLRATSRPM